MTPTWVILGTFGYQSEFLTDVQMFFQNYLKAHIQNKDDDSDWKDKD
jgi:hypothetical protein